LIGFLSEQTSKKPWFALPGYNGEERVPLTASGIVSFPLSPKAVKAGCYPARENLLFSGD